MSFFSVYEVVRGVCVCVRVCVPTGMYLGRFVCAHMLSPEDDIKCLCPLLSTLFIEAWSLAKQNLSIPISLAFAPGMLSLPPKVLELQSTTISAQYLSGYHESISSLHIWQALYQLSNLPNTKC